jgi:hypothetical protein
LAAEGTKVTIESLIQEVEEARRPPVAQRQLSAANTTIAHTAKLSGLWVDRSKVSGASLNLDAMSKKEIERLLHERFGDEAAEELIAWLERQAKKTERATNGF